MDNNQLTFSYNDKDGSKKYFISLSKDKAAFLGLFIIALCIVSYIFGVEKGKKSELKLTSPAITEPTNETLEIVQPTEQPSIQETADTSTAVAIQTSTEEPEPKQQEIYTLQIATYKKRDIAENELKKLKKEGIDSFILEKNEYTVLYAGKFSDEDQAESLSKKLRTRYKDHRIRRLSL